MNKQGNNKGFTKRVSNQEFENEAQKVIDNEVRQQVEVYQQLGKEESTRNAIVLSPAQKAHLACHSQL
ncbi:MAG: hypothetical protein COB12_04800 [Flavobacterium sp.]|nr:MAG: hypothetical protein COB12_04800 [Flavobacterium sp.]